MTRRRDNAIRRRHPGVRGVWSKRGNWYRPVHLYSRHFWLISRVFSTFLKAYCVEFSPSLLSFFPSFPLSGEDHFSTPLWPAIPRRISISLFSTLSLRHISLSLFLSFIFFVPSFSLLLRTLLFSVDSMVSGYISPCVHWGGKGRKKNGMESLATHPRLILLSSLSLESHRCPESSLANPSFQENATGLSSNRRDGRTVFSKV